MLFGNASSIPILMYHHVSPSAGPITTSPSNFENQLKWLKWHGYQSITTQQYVDYLNGHPLAAKSVMITFDDGYLDNWVWAYPILQKWGFNAVIFLVTSWVHDGPVRPCQGRAGHLPDTPDHHECERRINAGQGDDVVLRWSEIHEMVESGTFEFHSHTDTHTRWDLGDDKANKNLHMMEELTRSRQTLAARLGYATEHLCWPQGYFDEDYVQLAKQAGYRYLYTTLAFGQNKPSSNPECIHRFAVRNTTGESVGRRIWVARNPFVAPLFNGWKRWKRSRRERA
ncbi:polysaccharide deacetylase family protein [Neopusillimonas maritima]|jgi:peptidoglycan/xylan/chitin deacetylase (PgdA/CDA1 family)|uniref:NodB homology domain-containing protein n=1 Tax=Neopusillimonas maritima TaxID=2026239 RepID=A0A3A1YSK4_9BURK|nr:polysaccharide deacetylase family protein [Neopusillimonas maritima]MAL00992.1 hypothetical protein [Alcaligenaceae bacterium]RII82648.1 hypothetical protein CJO09_08600 [Neopusillimonas maritima]RIY40198.1 hypothetical protein CJP73_11275 [Neopusillimonas maritima]|tara:strand:- start:2487 stop:3338 length:852 start_codon:yes stop_codon:yes gene_type:complete